MVSNKEEFSLATLLFILFCFVRAKSHYVAIAGIEPTMVDQDGQEFTVIHLCLLEILLNSFHLLKQVNKEFKEFRTLYK